MSPKTCKGMPAIAAVIAVAVVMARAAVMAAEAAVMAVAAAELASLMVIGEGSVT